MGQLKFTEKLKQKWLAALQSGKFTHGKGQLINSNKTKHCCLGVLAEIHPRLGISESSACLKDGELVKGIDMCYAPFYELFGEDKVSELYKTNDATGTFSYDPVIPIIQGIETKK